MNEATISSYHLSQLEVLNWGPFHGRHCANIDPQGSAIIGQTGSGKTTLIDALMTLLCERPRYNLASTGGHESDRDLISYIRGKTGEGGDDATRHVARAQKTTSAIAASFSCGAQQVHIAVIFWIDSASDAAADRKDVWLFSEAAQSPMTQWLTTFVEGGARALKASVREQEDSRVFDTKKAYLAQLKRFFAVGEQAFTLLNRAVGLKQLNSIDQLFRELVLDEQSAFARAGEVVAEFDDLTAIRGELETARRQQATLNPLLKHHQSLTRSEQRIHALKQTQGVLPRAFAAQAQQYWQTRHSDLEQQSLDGRAALERAQRVLETKTLEVDIQQQRYHQHGGGELTSLAETIKLQQAVLATITQAHHDYQRLSDNLNIKLADNAQALAEQQQWAQSQLDDLHIKITAQQQVVRKASGELFQSEDKLNAEQQALEGACARPQSNIPMAFQHWRQALADALALSGDDLPFVAELVAVKDSEQAWRGAIERALGSHRLRVLVPHTHVHAALDWINQRDNHLHVRVYEAPEQTQTVSFFSDGFTRKLTFKTHPLREALKMLLADFDRHCVDDVAALRSTPHALTREGLMSGQRGRFDKHDQRPLSSDWLTGFDNQAIVAQLSASVAALSEQTREHRRLYQDSEQQLSALKQCQQLLQQLISLEFNKIDYQSVQTDLAHSEARYQRLTAPESDLAHIKAALDQAKREQNDANERRNQAQLHVMDLDNQISQTQQKLARASQDAQPPLTDDERALLSEHYPLPECADEEALNRAEKIAMHALHDRLEETREHSKEWEKKLVRQMEEALKEDRGALSEAGSELSDLPAYFERLRVLNEEDLPARQQRFLDYLNNASDQGVTQLLSSIDQQVSMIETRIEALNDTLAKVDFQPGEYLQLMPSAVAHQTLRDVQTALRQLRAAALKEDGGESHYQALLNLIALLRHAAENKRNSNARALLDPRYRLSFSVAVVSRADGSVFKTFQGSQGGSGGEKEIITSYLLTASLSYALAPKNASDPRFASIVLDEAFSRSSQAVAARIVAAIRAFGLHPLFVTPNKEMRLLREHTRAAILVYRREQYATLTSLSWQALDEQVRALNNQQTAQT